MLVKLTKDTITKDIKKGIWYWTSKANFYRDIKKVCENKYNNGNNDIKEIHIKWFDGLESLFNDYQDNTINYETIYRTDIIENKQNKKLSDDELFNYFCKVYTVNTVFKFDDMFCSFSTCKEASYYASSKNNKYSGIKTPQVIYILQKRLSKYFYIADYSQIPTEEEILYFGKSTFMVVEQKILVDNTVELHIIEQSSK